jgi:hypothetical protein
MGQARPLYVASEGLDDISHNRLELTLKEEHGAHGLKFLGALALNEVEIPQADLEINSYGEKVVFTYRDNAGEPVIESVDSASPRAMDRALSNFALKRLGLTLENQTSRNDYLDLSEYMGVRPILEGDPSKWITSNPFVSDLCRRYPQYGNMVRFLCNERGLFLKVGNHANQRAYWNSTLNGGLPAFKKADPVHEGTFMLHDLFHFIPTDPLLGEIQPGEEHKAGYIAHRLLSEASTLVLADMVAVADARLKEQGYDVSKRKIFPVYESIVNANGGKKPGADKLLAANAYFCFTGDTQGFEAMGASRETLIEYRAKYEAIFRDDFLWNLQNYEAMTAELEDNPLMQEYYNWIATNTALPTLDAHTASVTTPEGGIDIPKMLSVFRADFTKALNYSQPIDDAKRLQLAYQKYLAGQRVVFARFGRQIDTEGFIESFDSSYSSLSLASTPSELSMHGQEANMAVDNYLTRLADEDVLLPHEEALYRFSAPLYPIKFVNYEKRKDQPATKLVEDMQSFIHMNKAHLTRLLEAAQA